MRKKNFINPLRVRAALLFLLLCLPLTLAPEARTRARGKLASRPGGAALDGARIVILEARQTLESDENGEFEFAVDSPGLYTFRIYYEDKLIQRRVDVQPGRIINIYLEKRREQSPQTPTKEKQIVTGDIEIVGLRRKDQTKLSRFTLNRDEIKRLPGVYGDSLKAVTTLPGITPAPPIGVLPSVNLLTSSSLGGFSLGPPYSNSRSGVLVLRGAGARASRFYLDGFTIQYPFHLGDQSSVLNNDFIRAVDVYTGTYPARFGNATGGIIAITGPEEVKEFEGHINVSLFLADIFLSAPLFEKQGYIVGTARRSYPNYALLTLYPAAIPANAKYALYNDYQFKMGVRLGLRHELTAIYFGARDKLQYTQSVAEATNENNDGSSGGFAGGLSVDNTNGNSRPPVGLERSYHTQGFKYDFKYGDSVYNTLSFQVSRYKENFELDFRSPLTGESIFEFLVEDHRTEIQYRDEFTLGLYRDNLYLNLGLESNQNHWGLALQNLSQQRSTNPNTPDFVETINQLLESNRTFRSLFDGDRTDFTLNAAYAELEIEFWRLRLTPGVRGEYLDISKSTGVGPRMGAELQIEETGTTILAGAGRHFNVPTSQELISEDAGNPNLQMEESEHLALGVDQKIGKYWLFKIEAYRNLYYNMVVEDQFEIEPFSLRDNNRDLVTNLNEIRLKPLENRPLSYSNDGTGYSNGIEIYLKKTRAPGRNGWFGWASYSYSLTKRNNHQPRLSSDEQTALNTRNTNRNLLARFHYNKNDLHYYDNGEYELFLDNDKEELYDLDRTHQLSLVYNYKFNANWQIGGRWIYATNVPYTPITGNDEQIQFAILGRLTFIEKYSDFYNSARLKPKHQLDIRLDYFLNYAWGYANYYVEIINVYARRNPESESYDNLYPYARGQNPAVAYESTFIQTPVGQGRTLLLPLINMGIEIRF